VTQEPLPDDVRRFVLTSIPSVPYLEALLLLRSQPERAWDPPTVARRLYVPEARAAELLRALRDSSLVVTAEGSAAFRYEPQDATLRDMVERLDRLYVTRLVEITSLIHTRVEKRALQFADAFRWKKEP
jgi:hypothetical protein